MEKTLILVAGLPGTGKSFFADRLGERIGARVLRSDEIRKEISGLSEGEKRYEEFGEGIYNGSSSEKTYLEMIERARKCIEKGESCILDATFSKRKNRNRALGLAEELGIPSLVVECTCPEEVIVERITSRTSDGKSISDATISIYRRMKERFEKIEEDEVKVVVDTSKDVDSLIERFATYQRTITQIPVGEGKRDFFGVRNRG